MSAATCPTNFLSIPAMAIFVLSVTVILISFGMGNKIGCDFPRARLRVEPCTAALKPTPSISRFFENPSLTPSTMLWTRLRERPCKAFTFRASASRTSETRLSFTLALISRGRLQLSFPFGPSTATAPSLPMFTFTLSGISTALFPIRDIKLKRALPDVSQQLASHVLFFRFAPGQNPARRRENRHAHSAEHARNFLRAHITAEARTAHAFQTGDRARPVRDLVRDLDPRMRRFGVHGVIDDVAFVFQNAHDLRFDLRIRNKRLGLLRVRGIAHASEKVG